MDGEPPWGFSSILSLSQAAAAAAAAAALPSSSAAAAGLENAREYAYIHVAAAIRV